MRVLPLREQPAWQALEDHWRVVKDVTLGTLFAEDASRGERLVAETDGVYLDYSRNRVSDETLTLLARLADASRLRDQIDAMFRGDKINVSEDRPALHGALRAPRGAIMAFEGQNVVPGVHDVLDRMSAFSEQIRVGRWTGYTKKPIRNVVNIGIGGSELGPTMAYEALIHYSKRDLTFRFVSNIDGADFSEGVRNLNAEETLFVVASKTFTTLETMTNARTARSWLTTALGNDPRAVARHFVAVSADIREALTFGIPAESVFELWSWVGGRYSVDSAIGLSIMLSVGPENFRALLHGFRLMDTHFQTAPFEANLPVLMGLLSIWYNNFFGAHTAAILPYARSLARFPGYVQQLAMESNGKQVTVEGAPVDYDTSPVLWGSPGTNGQHSFFQLLHQGTRFVPCDFIAFARPLETVGAHHDLLLANMLAQGRALAFGRSEQDLLDLNTPSWLVPHRILDGNRPSNTLLFDQLTPTALGQLVALYEHSVFTQGAIWHINSFDQWGVEYGKALTERIVPQLQCDTEPVLDHDSSTNALIRRCRMIQRVP